MRLKKAFSIEAIVLIAVLVILFGYISNIMGGINMINTLMKTAHDLLINTVFFIMAIAVIAGSLAGIFSEFGVVSLINIIFAPFMKWIFRLPGVSVLGIVTTYLSDNPAVITLSEDKEFKKHFKKYQLPALTNLGTSFGMGLIVTAFMIGQSLNSKGDENFVWAAIAGNIGAFIGAIVSVNIMLFFTKKKFGTKEWAEKKTEAKYNILKYREVRSGSMGNRILDALLEGGKSGVKVGMEIIPGVLIICTFIMMLTNGAKGEGGEYLGVAYEGVGLLPAMGQKISFIIEPLFGFKNPEAIAFPITALGAVGAAISLVPELLKQGLIGGNEIAVFTAMGMCWSGYLSTHIAMMDSLNFRNLTGKAILSHTFGGLMAGISAHFLYILFA